MAILATLIVGGAAFFPNGHGAGQPKVRQAAPPQAPSETIKGGLSSEVANQAPSRSGFLPPKMGFYGEERRK